MELKELINIVKKDEELIIRYREDNQKVYYLGQRLLDIDLKNNIVTLPETLKLSGKEFKEKIIKNISKRLKNSINIILILKSSVKPQPLNLPMPT